MKKPVFVAIGLSVSVFVAFIFFSGKKDSTELAINPRDGKRPTLAQTLRPKVFEAPTSVDQLPSSSEEQGSSLGPDRDHLLWRKESDAIEEAWNDEIYLHIQYVDREHADELYRAYAKSRRDYLNMKNPPLSDALDDLLKLNGQSIPSDDEFLTPEVLHNEFVTNLKLIFRQHYSHIEERRKVFLDAQVSAQEGAP